MQMRWDDTEDEDETSDEASWMDEDEDEAALDPTAGNNLSCWMMCDNLTGTVGCTGAIASSPYTRRIRSRCHA